VDSVFFPRLLLAYLTLRNSIKLSEAGCNYQVVSPLFVWVQLPNGLGHFRSQIRGLYCNTV